jgi:hypothetical protein
MTQKYNDSIKSAVFVFERLEQHTKEHGQPVKNDAEMWKEVDFNSADPELSTHWILNLQSLAKFNNHWDTEMTQWCTEVLMRKPVHLRQRGDKWTTNNNNVMIWRLMMLFREVVNQELDMMELNTFNEHFEITQ